MNFLLNETRAGKLNWQSTAAENQFTVSLRGKYNVLVAKDAGYSRLQLIDDKEQVLVELYSTDLDEVEILFEYVRRKALDVDRAIDEILKS